MNYIKLKEIEKTLNEMIKKEGLIYCYDGKINNENHPKYNSYVGYIMRSSEIITTFYYNNEIEVYNITSKHINEVLNINEGSKLW